ncbi:MAG TPA: AMP-binding protein, partial [Mycobacterium sp.]|nr:AMP-binding protein [Mycobacterium sp.]
MGVTQGLHRVVQQTPELPATIFQGRVRTWAESADRVARLAGALRAIGVQRGDRVAMLALNSDRYHEYLFAVPWAGAVLNPVNTRWSPAEITYSLNDSESRVLIVDDTFSELASTLKTDCPDLVAVIHCGESPCPRGMFDYEELIASHDPVDDAYLTGSDL